MIRKLLGFALVAIILLIPLTMTYADQWRNEFVALVENEICIVDSFDTDYELSKDTIHLPPALYKGMYLALAVDVFGTAAADDSLMIECQSYLMTPDSQWHAGLIEGIYIVSTALVDTVRYLTIAEAGEAEHFVITTSTGSDGTGSLDSARVTAGYIPIEHETGF